MKMVIRLQSEEGEKGEQGGGGDTFSTGILFEKRDCGWMACAFLVPLVASMADMMRCVCMRSFVYTNIIGIHAHMCT